MDVVAFDKFVSAERFRELGVEGAETIEELYGRADLDHHPPAEDARDDQLDRRRGDRADEGRRPHRQLRPRRADRPRGARARRSSRGKVGGAALDVFPAEPITEHPLFEPRRRRRHPAPGRLDRRGPGPGRRSSPPSRSPPPSPAAWSPTPSTSPPSGPEDDGGAGAVRPALREARPPRPGPRRRLGRPRRASSSAAGIAEHDTRLLGIAALVGILSGHTEEPVNLVNAPQLAEERGIELTETQATAVSEDFTELVTVRIESGDETVEVAGTGVGPRNEPYLVRVWGESFYLPFADHLVVFRYTDQPGMIGRVGTIFGEQGVNIVSAAVGAEAGRDEAVMALTTDAPVPASVVEEILELDGLPRRAAPWTSSG